MNDVLTLYRQVGGHRLLGLCLRIQPTVRLGLGPVFGWYEEGDIRGEGGNQDVFSIT